MAKRRIGRGSMSGARDYSYHRPKNECNPFKKCVMCGQKFMKDRPIDEFCDSCWAFMRRHG